MNGAKPKKKVWVAPVAKQDKVVMNLKFQVADVRKPLISVNRISELNNYTHFGPEAKDNYIENSVTGDRIALVRKGVGSYVMKVQFLEGCDTEIVVDSGAEENVCPRWWGQKFGLFKPQKWLNLVNASGSRIEHFGSRIVKVISPF